MNNIYFDIIKDINNENNKSKSTFQQYKWECNIEEDNEEDNIFSYNHLRKSSNSSVPSNNNRINTLKFTTTSDRSLPSSPSYSSPSSSNSPNPFKSSHCLSKLQESLSLKEINSKLNNKDDDLSHLTLRKIKSSLLENENYQNNNKKLFKAKSMISLPSSSTKNSFNDKSLNNNSILLQKENLYNIKADDIVSRNISENISFNEFINKEMSNRHVPPTPINDADNPFIESSEKIKKRFKKNNLFNIVSKNDSFQTQSTLLNYNDSEESDSSCPSSPLLSHTPLKFKSTKNLKNKNLIKSLKNINNDSEIDAPYKHTRNYSKRMEQLSKNALQTKKSSKIKCSSNHPSKLTIMNLNESIDNSCSTNNNISFVYNTRSKSKHNCSNQNEKNNKNTVKSGPILDTTNKKSSKSKSNNLGIKIRSPSSPLMKENNDSAVNSNNKNILVKKKNNNNNLTVATLKSPNTKAVADEKNINLENKGLYDKILSKNMLKTKSSIKNSNISSETSQRTNESNVTLNQEEILLPQLKQKKLNLSCSSDTLNDDPSHITSLSHQNSINVDDSQNILNKNSNQSSLQSQQVETPSKNNSFIISQDDTTKTEKSLTSSTSNFVNMVLLPKKTPQKTPSSKRRNSMCGDRFIPNYLSGDKETQYNLAGPITPSKGKRKLPPGECDAVKEEQNKIYDSVVKIELLGQDMYDNPLDKINRHRNSIYSFKTPKKRTYQMMNTDSPIQQKYSLTPVSQASQHLLLTPKKATRHISKTPYKVLDAPELQDDFYLNLVDWSSTNQLSVGLGSCVYLWSACNSRVTRLCDLGPFDSVTSVNWMQKGTHLAVGTNRGLVQLWDIERGRKIRQFVGHQARVGSLAWNGNILTSGSRDRQILNRDIRISNDYIKKYLGHKQEVCGLKWNYEENQLASGGNDNKLFVWDKASTTPLFRFEDHVAAVKAVSWSPHQRGLLASGGGTADRKILFWNTQVGSILHGIDTGSQVCNLSWSKTTNELVSTHGYSQNQIIIWKYPSLHQIATLIGHTYRVLYLAMSPDGQNIVTGAGDETLRFWNVFNKSKSKETHNSALSSFGHIR